MFKIISIVSLFSYITSKGYIKKRYDKKNWKGIAISDYLTLIIIPILFYILWIVMINDIMHRPRVDVLPISDFFIIALTIPLIGISAMGNGIHFVSRVIFKSLNNTSPSHHIFHLNQKYHNLSHFPVLIGGFLTFFLLSILEANHPLIIPLTKFQIISFAAFAIFIGYTSGFVIKYINADFPIYLKPLFCLMSILLLINYLLFLALIDHISYYPITLLVTVSYFSIVVILINEIIYANLHRKNITWWKKIFGRFYHRSFLKEVERWRDSNHQ